MATWDTLDRGARITGPDAVAPGDVAFLELADGRLAAFTVTTAIRSSDGRLDLYSSPVRHYTLGGASRVRFHHAIRPEADQ